MSDIRSLIRKRGVYRASFTKIVASLQVLLEKEIKDIVAIRGDYALVEEKANLISNLDQEIFQHLMEDAVSEEDLITEVDGVDDYKRKFHMLAAAVSDALAMERKREDEVQSTVSTSNTHNLKSKYRLPKIEFRKFGGNLRDWLGFWNQFQKIDEDEGLDNADKYEYLIQATLPNSKARDIVDSFPATSGNYPKAIQKLKSRFGKDSLLVEVYTRELLTMMNSCSSLDISSLYDRLETQLGALESLGVTSEKYAAMLFPMIESCLSIDVLRAWQRSGGGKECEPSERLKGLMKFLENEVESEERIKLAIPSKGNINVNPDKSKGTKKIDIYSESPPTAAALVDCNLKLNCIFCDRSHASSNCSVAKQMALKERVSIVKNKRACFLCLKKGHVSKMCRSQLKCDSCSKKHNSLICLGPTHSSEATNEKLQSHSLISNEERSGVQGVILQTLKVKVIGESSAMEVRALLDTGSQRSYMLESVAQKLGYSSHRTEMLRHSLFGGVVTEESQHMCYRIYIESLGKPYACNFEVLGQQVITGYNTMLKGPWLQELRAKGIHNYDTEGPIELLIGADVAGKLMTGQTCTLSNGLVCIETLLGWTVMGKVVSGDQSSMTNLVTSLFIRDASVENLWELDVLGISDPAVKKTKTEENFATMEHFQKTVSINGEFRYEVHLPWKENKSFLVSNRVMAEKRLVNTRKKVENFGLGETYENIFTEWERSGVIEPVQEDENFRHYLPHRAVVKESSSTTPVRPVFDASAKEVGTPALNDCLYDGPNLIELIPAILLRFRERKVGIIADIEKAFLQISIRKEDRNYICFLMWQDVGNNYKIFKHARLVFGLTCSPFLLVAVLEYHLKKYLENPQFNPLFIERLLQSFYVDNVVTSLDRESEVGEFINQASRVLSEGSFNLRGWQFSQDDDQSATLSSVLGLLWDRQEDTLTLNLHWLNSLQVGEVTKRTILSLAHRIFDPVGVTCPVTLCVKLLIQRTWKTHIRWDSAVDEKSRDEFLAWVKDLPHLVEIKIPRWFGRSDHVQIHVFCDASQLAYAAVVFIRCDSNNQVSVQLCDARSRVAPLKEVTIPRLELLAATIGARLLKCVLESISLEVHEFFLWSDSSTVLAWICRTENWSVFVRNRVNEIRNLTNLNCWRHVPGSLNPADLPSRGCSASQLVASRWWEGPAWLYESPDCWPQTKVVYDEESIAKEMKKNPVNSMTVTNEGPLWYARYFSSYHRIVHLIAWILRFCKNCLRRERISQENLQVEELERAEIRLISIIQRESFHGLVDKRLSSLHPFLEDGVLRVKTRLLLREDLKQFRFPMILPANHVITSRLIMDEHVKENHIGVQLLLNHLRQRFWIIGGRRTVRKIIRKCVKCRRHDGQHTEIAQAPLPLDRIREACVFEVIGVDLAGPVFLRDESKAWIVVFTCAVYRAVHLEMVTSLSTEAFVQAFRRFVARRGRPSVIYSDNGTNFTGTDNAFQSVDWENISKHYSVERITWRFNPPSAPWWGGFWERLIRLIKQLLKRVLGKACLTYQEMLTLLCSIEATINARPLTYLTDGCEDISPLTPACFLQEIKTTGVPECDALDAITLNQRNRHLLNLRMALKKRFQQEYLGLLALGKPSCKPTLLFKRGDIVLVGSDGTKRIDWPLGKIVDLFPGTDGNTRLARVVTSKGELLRPIQRLYPLEVPDEDSTPLRTGLNKKTATALGEPTGTGVQPPKTTRSGRTVNVPARYVE